MKHTKAELILAKNYREERQGREESGKRSKGRSFASLASFAANLGTVGSIFVCSGFRGDPLSPPSRARTH